MAKRKKIKKVAEKQPKNKEATVKNPSETPIKGKAIYKQKNKQSKQTMKKKKLAQKIIATQKMKKEDVAKRKREKTVITGDLKPLHDALPSIDNLFSLKRDEIKTGIADYDKVPKKKKLQTETEEYMNRYNLLKNLMKKKNIREFLSEKLKTNQVSSDVNM